MQKDDVLSSLPANSLQWIQENEWIDGTKAFLGVDGMSSMEFKARVKAVITAIQWYVIYDKGMDSKTVTAEVLSVIKDLLRKRKDETQNDYDQRMKDHWCAMCQHAAEYAFAGIESSHPFNRALWGCFRSFLNEDLILEEVDIPIHDAIRNAFKERFANDEVSYGIVLNGLDSVLVIPPAKSIAWTDYCDMYIRQVMIK
jgi:hypothetical protein